ncbi:hypothetical protein KC678_04890 [Candidatus Dojkabacteria bacterium]|uniref:Uncharacterized protein n=1 Tax=Candidatus Dojkabacteria bacterium TaxID=2099670 RepID=A0A955L2A5_9BACT|nr:hypothetical protein [Candidatus Dojkabacteria bacterium]
MADKKSEKKTTKKTEKNEVGMFKHYALLLDNKHLLVKDFVALSFFVAALFVMSPLAFESNVTKFLLALYGLTVIAVSIWIIITFFIKTARLQLDPKVKRYSAIVSLNSFFGFSMPLFYINIVLAKVVIVFLGTLPKTGSLLCRFRAWLDWFLYSYVRIDNKLELLFIFSVLLAFTVFMIGGVWERSMRK